MKNIFLFLALFVLSVAVYAQDQNRETLQDSTKTQQLEEVLVSAVRVKGTAPITHSNLTKAQLEQRNLGQDIPSLLNFLPSVVTTSDAGAGIGYTGIRVRGTDATRVNVTINGIPYNDPESQGSFWVNLGDFASSVQSLQLQRGVGTSTNGSGAFGASLNMLTDTFSEKASAEIANSFGSYNTRKHTVKLSTGLLNEHFEVSGRFSKIYSDGYVDRAFTDLKSYFLQGIYKDDNTLIKALTFGNAEQTYQAWYGLTASQLEEDRRQNPYTYDNETDNYWQDHYQLHWNEKWTKHWSTNLGLNYTKGKGYFEQYKPEESAADFNNLIQDNSDVIVRRWLDNNFYVANASVTYKKNGLELISGLSYSTYTGDHYGEIIWGSDLAPNTSIRDKYYNGDATKNDFSIFSKATFKLVEKLTGFVDLQGRFVGYKTNGVNSSLNEFITNAHFSFFNPKVGLTFKQSNKSSFYTSYARANREPNRDDFKAGVTENETLNDLELGWRYNTPKIQLNTNIYYMFYQNQLVLTGEVDDVGSPIRATSGKSYRLGLEVDAIIKFSNAFNMSPNLALSTNKNRDFNTTQNDALVKLGNTNISFSPNVVVGNAFNYYPVQNLQLSLLSKFVGKQYLNNIEDERGTLKSYFVSDFNANYEIVPKKIFKSIIFSGLVNNMFNKKYVSNGADYGGGYVYYYPQATTNFLLGLTLKF